MSNSNDSPKTRIFSIKEFAKAFRAGSLCLPFQDLKLAGPEGEFSAQGLLVSRPTQVNLEFSPIPADGSTIPTDPKLRMVSSSDFWRAEGTTFHGLKIQMPGIMPPYHNSKSTNGHVSFNRSLEQIKVFRDDSITDEMLMIIEGETKASESCSDELIHPVITMKAYLAETELRFFNEGTSTETKHSFFSNKSSSLDSLGGRLLGWQFCFRQDGNDVILHVCSEGKSTHIDASKDQRIIDGLLAAFSFMHGCEAVPWRVERTRNRQNYPDLYRPIFSPAHGAARPFDGPSSLSIINSFPMKMLCTMAGYFSSDCNVAARIRQHLWQLIQATANPDVRLYGCMHLCAIFEGVSKDLLKHRFSWSDSKLKKTTAINRFRELAKELHLPWDGQFEDIVTTWKNMRDALAHGGFFEPHTTLGQNLFDLQFMVSNGIFALMLADAGWTEPFDFKNVRASYHLYYC